ncbi:MAG TPA: hypothetical protein VFB00_08960 [Terriglobales bacterium]|nr:hypothetical protein [Terriglobales bacterium]
MEIKHLITKYVYRIEPKPDGGFIARASDPGIPPLEAPTRTELQQKIQDTIAAGLAQDFPGLKLPLQSNELKFSFHVERNADGGFDIHSSDPNASPISASSHDEVESHFAEKLIGFIGKHLAPELSQALAAQGSSGDVKVFVKKTGFTVRTGAHGQDSIKTDGTVNSIELPNTGFADTGSALDNSPITPESGNAWPILRFLLAALVLAAVMYFLLHHR